MQCGNQQSGNRNITTTPLAATAVAVIHEQCCAGSHKSKGQKESGSQMGRGELLRAVRARSGNGEMREELTWVI